MEGLFTVADSQGKFRYYKSPPKACDILLHFHILINKMWLFLKSKVKAENENNRFKR